jgi:hydrogenase maturation protein HypF
VQHHHAHIASVLAEHGAKRAIGIAFDGTGFGDDGTIWGGEVLIATLSDYQRFAWLRPVPLPGGEAAIKHPQRMTFSLLLSLGLSNHAGAAALCASLGKEQLSLLETIITSGLGSPLTSSMGRLFDAVSALCSLCTEPSYEGQPAVELEAALYREGRGGEGRARFEPQTASSPPAARFALALPLIDPTPVMQALLDGLAAGLEAPALSLRFHRAVIELIVEVSEAAREATGLRTVALSGGVFMNRYLLEHALPALQKAGFTVLINRELPANDGCISYGQAAVAQARLAQCTPEGLAWADATPKAHSRKD